MQGGSINRGVAGGSGVRRQRELYRVKENTDRQAAINGGMIGVMVLVECVTARDRKDPTRGLTASAFEFTVGRRSLEESASKG